MKLMLISILFFSISSLSFMLYLFEKEDQGEFSLDYDKKLGIFGTFKRIFINLYHVLKADVLKYCPWSEQKAVEYRISHITEVIQTRGEFEGWNESVVESDEILEQIAQNNFEPRVVFWRQVIYTLLGKRIFTFFFDTLKFFTLNFTGFLRLITGTTKPY